MTPEKMIAALEDGPMSLGSDDDYVLVPVATANKIAAALRAGQGMYDEFKDLPDLFRSSIETRLKRALDGWDAATKGESEV
jgi:hypothetical protein